MKNFLGIFIGILPFMNPSATGSEPKNQGIEGHIYRISGNQMPSPDVKPAKPRGIRTTLYIFELTSLSQVDRENNSPFYKSIQTRQVKKVESNTEGYFKVRLPAGHYSLFVKKDTLYYANWFDGANHIAPVEVLPGKMTRIDFKVDYDASY